MKLWKKLIPPIQWIDSTTAYESENRTRRTNIMSSTLFAWFEWIHHSGLKIWSVRFKNAMFRFRPAHWMRIHTRDFASLLRNIMTWMGLAYTTTWTRSNKSCSIVIATPSCSWIRLRGRNRHIYFSMVSIWRIKSGKTLHLTEHIPQTRWTGIVPHYIMGHSSWRIITR